MKEIIQGTMQSTVAIRIPWDITKHTPGSMLIPVAVVAAAAAAAAAAVLVTFSREQSRLGTMVSHTIPLTNNHCL